MKSSMLHERRIFGDVTTLGGIVLPRSGVTPVPPYGAVAVSGPSIVSGNSCAVGNTFIYKQTNVLPPIESQSIRFEEQIVGGKLQWRKIVGGLYPGTIFAYNETWSGTGTITLYLTLQNMFQGSMTIDPSITIFAARNFSTATNMIGMSFDNGGASGEIRATVSGVTTANSPVTLGAITFPTAVKVTSTRVVNDFTTRLYVNNILIDTIVDTINPANSVGWNPKIIVSSFSSAAAWGNNWAEVSDFYAVASSGFPGVCVGQG